MREFLSDNGIEFDDRNIRQSDAARADLATRTGALVVPQLFWRDRRIAGFDPDALTRIRMHTLLRKLCGVHKPAVLLVTHDVDEAIVLADRVIVLDDGVVRHDAQIELDGRRSVADPAFARLRARLLAELGVEDDHDAARARHGLDERTAS